MLLQLRKKLTLLYTLITGLILTGVVITLAVITNQSDIRQREALFTNQLMTIANKLQYDSKISQEWLSSMEHDSGLIIHIEENSRPLLYFGSPTVTSRSILVEHAGQIALTESIDTHIPPASTSLEKTSIFQLKGDHSDMYLGTVMVFSARDSYFSLTLLMDITTVHQRMFYQKLLFLLADIAGILCLMLVNWKFVGKSLDPIRINEEKQQAFIAAASHELRSPLAVIVASADAITSEKNHPERFIGSIKEECKRMSRLIQDLLLLASSKSNSWSLLQEEVDMDTLLLNTYERYEELCKSKELLLKLELPKDSLPPIYSDGERIMNILSIFLDNGISYAPSGTSLILQAYLQKHTLTCAVIDHGPGIPEEQKKHVFEYFYRSDVSRKEKNHFGLGLCVAAELARLLKGHLELKDTPGGGCTFLLKLPLNENHAS